MRKNKKFIDPRYFMDEKMELNEGAAWGGTGRRPKQPRELGLPNDIGTPEKLLAGVEKILKNPELSSGQSKSQIDASTAADIVKHINSKLKENPPDQGTIKRLQDAKRILQTMHGGESTADKRAASSKIHQTQREEELAHQRARERAPVTSMSTMGIGERKLSKSQLKQIIKEELAEVTNRDKREAFKVWIKDIQRELEAPDPAFRDYAQPDATPQSIAADWERGSEIEDPKRTLYDAFHKGHSAKHVALDIMGVDDLS